MPEIRGYRASDFCYVSVPSNIEASEGNELFNLSEKFQFWVIFRNQKTEIHWDIEAPEIGSRNCSHP